VPNEVARETAYEKLLADLLVGDFEEHGVSQIMYLHPYTSKTRMTREWLIGLLEFKNAERATIISQYLAHCWIPRNLFDQWLAKHRMQYPPRFEPKWPRPPATTRQPVRQAREAVVPPVIAEGVEHGASDAERKTRPGPKPDTVRRYAAADFRLFPELKRIMNKEQKSLTAAALDLAQADRIAGVGTPQSRAKRLAGLYQRERGGAPQGRGSKSRRRPTSG
jgi:hypothetical protein